MITRGLFRKPFFPTYKERKGGRKTFFSLWITRRQNAYREGLPTTGPHRMTRCGTAPNIRFAVPRYVDIPVHTSDVLAHRANRQPTLHCECPKATSRPPTLEVANQDGALYGASQNRSHKDQLLSPRCGSEVVAPRWGLPTASQQGLPMEVASQRSCYGACVDAQAYRSTHVLTLL